MVYISFFFPYVTIKILLRPKKPGFDGKWQKYIKNGKNRKEKLSEVIVHKFGKKGESDLQGHVCKLVKQSLKGFTCLALSPIQTTHNWK